MKLKRKLKLKPKGVAFADLVREAVEVTRELRALDNVAASKLTAEAYLRDAMRIAQTTSERLAKLRSELERPTGHNTFEAAATLRRMVAAIRSSNWPRPPRELRRLNFLTTPETVAELAALGSSTFELFALGVQIAAEKHSADFGNCEDGDGYDRRLLDLAMRRDELYRQIENAYTSNDLLIGEPDAQGRSVVSFKLSGGAVPLGPHAGERLVNWMLINNQDA